MHNIVSAANKNLKYVLNYETEKTVRYVRFKNLIQGSIYVFLTRNEKKLPGLNKDYFLYYKVINILYLWLPIQ